MARIVIDNLAHSYVPGARFPEDYALKHIDMTWEDGGAYALLGPSGCGKTTMLNIISGLLTPSRGRVLYDDRDVTALPPEKRNIAQVFQFPVLYDTMTVYGNLAFPLKNRGLESTAIDARVREVADILDLTPVLGRRAAGLSADAKQKISLGRGLVRSDVAAILFDEPLTVIDPHLKWQLRRKLKEIHKQFQLTLVYVTHDQVEALTFADKVVVMYEGEIVQVGTPEQLFENPEHTFVGYFIGSPGMNILPCTVEDDAVRFSGSTFAVPPEAAAAAREAGGEKEMGIRPLYVEVSATESDGRVQADIVLVEDLGSTKVVTTRLGGHNVKCLLPEEQPVPEGSCWLRFPPEKIKLFAGGRLVG